MDPGHILRQGLGSVPARVIQSYTTQFSTPPRKHDDLSDEDGPNHRVAHTLTACCRCRQRKTRCDPTLPRCLPCERSGSTCEYFDTAKGKKINRYYVVKLQDKVRALEAELAQFTDDEHDLPRTTEDIVRPGGMIRLKASDETPRYLGPSSGIAMTRLLMEEAKRYTASNRISDLIPEVRNRSIARMQSIQMNGPPTDRKKSYPAISEAPATGLPSREVMDKLSALFMQESQTFWPVLHEKDFQKDLESVYNGDQDPYKNFVLRMVIAISLQKIDAQYAGLADSYYLAAMVHAETVIRPKDLKTLQCLILIGHYSLLTPSRAPVYHVIGLATRICQQEGLTDEKTISAAFNADPQTVDLRRRLVWIVASLDFGLAWHMGRPCGFASGKDRLDVSFFANVDDDHITPDGIVAGPPDDRKLVSMHFFRAREFQAEIKRTLYEQKRPEPTNDSNPWYAGMEKKMKTWLDGAPQAPQSSPSWFAKLYHHTRVVLYRPSPQVPQPSARAAEICFESSKSVINLTRNQLERGWFSIAWAQSLTLTSSLNVLLWSTSYAEVRQAHARQEVEDLVNMALACLEKCVERLHAPAHTCELYSIISKACLQSYERGSDQHPIFSFASPSSTAETQASSDEYTPTGGSQQHVTFWDPPQFGLVFDSPPESMSTYTFDPNCPPPLPTFRSNSIFGNPASDVSSRRFSYFPPEGTPEDLSTAASVSASASATATSTPGASAFSDHTPSPSLGQSSEQVHTPPDLMSTLASTFSPAPLSMQSSTLSDASSAPRVVPMNDHMSPPPSQGTQTAQATPNFTTAKVSVPQRPLPANSSTADWFYPPAPFVTPYNFGHLGGNSLFNHNLPNSFGGDLMVNSGGLQHLSSGFDIHSQIGSMPGRQGSLTQTQLAELLTALETEGLGDIDAFLNTHNNMAEMRWC